MGKARAESSPGPIAESLVVDVTALASDGSGIARTPEGRVVFVDGGVPGDRARLAPTTQRRRVLRARIAELLRASPDRREARCRHFGDCGGCVWQQIRYPAQLEAKRRIVQDALRRIGGIEIPGEVEIVASPDEFHYRARTRVVATAGGVGYRRRASNEVLAVEECPVLLPEVEAARAGLADRVRREDGGRGGVSEADAVVREWFVTGDGRGTARTFACEAERPSPGKAEASLRLELLGESIGVRGAGFVQGNALLWEKLALAVRTRCLEPVAARAPRRFVELYAGNGFLTLPLARAGLCGIAVESDPDSAADLAANLAAAGLAASVEARAAAVERCGELASWLAAADLLLVDPPRAGLDAAVCETIARAGPRVFVYVSCDPATLARDLRRLVGAGYRLDSVVAFDLFPQTPHVETVVRLTREPA